MVPRTTRLLSAALALLMLLPAQASADGHKRNGSYSARFGQQSGEHEHARHDDDEEEDDGGGAATPAAQAAPAVTINELSVAIQSLAADPANLQVRAIFHSLVKAGGPTGIPGLWVEGKPLSVAPLVNQSGVSVMLRPVAEALGVKLSVDPATGAITLTAAKLQSRLLKGRTAATVNGKTVTLDAAPFLVGNTTYVSVQTVAELLPVQVIYDQTTRIVVISSVTAPSH